MNVFDKFVISNTEPESTKVLWILRDTDSEGANARAFIDGKWRSIGNDTNLSAYLTIEAYQEYMNQYYKKNETDTKLFGKIDKPEVIGTAGQILSLNAQGKPTWSNPAAGSVMDDTMSDESENPVQNKVIKGYVDDVAETKASKNGYYETLGAGTATNLKGDTVTDNTFIYRQTGGSQNVASGSAQIESIKGNSIAWNQIISNGDFKNGTIYWLLQQGTDAVVSTTDGLEIEAITSTNENSQIGKAIGNNLLVDTHKFYFHFDIKRNEIENKEFIFYTGNGWRQRITVDTFYIDEPNQWVSKTYISTITDSGVNRLVFWYKDATPDIGTRWALNNVIAIDLTRIYGSGNEPSTPEQFEADYFKWFGKPLGYEAYDAGSLIPVKMSGIKTVGFNLYANGGARVIKGNQYYIDGTYTSVTYSDGTAITPSSHLFTVDRNDTLVITGGDNTTIVNLNDAEKNGTYEAHWENEQNLPITQLKGRLDGTGELVTVFPDGLKRAGDVYDEIKVENGVVKAIKRVGVIDLGTLIYSNIARSTQIFRFGINDYKPSNIVNVICYKYPATTTQLNFSSSVSEINDVPNTIITKYTISDVISSQLCIKDTNYDDVNTFKAAMNGVMLYYELQTPQEYIIEGVDLPMGYKEENGGTEEVLVPAPTEGETTSCAPTLGLRYPYDAKGEIENIKTTLGNADTVPTKNSTDLITSGAVAAHGSALDVSLLNADTTTTPITLATYADLSAALAAIPSAYQSGGMSVKFIQLTPAKYTVVKTEGIVEQPTGTEIQSDPGVNSGTYSANELSAFSSLPATLNSSLTYYLTVTETVDEQEVTTYTTWSITMVQTSDNKYVQYRYMGTSTANTDFINVDNWEKTTNLEDELLAETSARIAAVNAEAVARSAADTSLQNAINAQNTGIADFEETVTNQINEYSPIEITGDVTNAPDEEDLTSVSQSGTDVLKFKNRNNLNGMGYIILRRDASFASQLIQTNTIYEIRYDFDLDDAEGENPVTIPSNCVLDFKGGSLSNGTIVFDDTYIEGNPKFDVDFSGTIKNGMFNVLWISTGDVGAKFNRAQATFKELYMPAGTFIFTTPVVLDGIRRLECHATLKYNGTYKNCEGVFIIQKSAEAIINFNWLSPNSTAGISYKNNRTVNTVGLEIRSCNNNHITIQKIGSFNENIRISDIHGLGCCYNHFYIGVVYNGNRNLRIYQHDTQNSSKSWCNENTIHGGRFTHYSTTASYDDKYDVVIGGPALDSDTYLPSGIVDTYDTINAIIIEDCSFEKPWIPLLVRNADFLYLLRNRGEGNPKAAKFVGALARVQYVNKYGTSFSKCDFSEVTRVVVNNFLTSTMAYSNTFCLSTSFKDSDNKNVPFGFYITGSNGVVDTARYDYLSSKGVIVDTSTYKLLHVTISAKTRIHLAYLDSQLNKITADYQNRLPMQSCRYNSNIKSFASGADTYGETIVIPTDVQKIFVGVSADINVEQLTIYHDGNAISVPEKKLRGTTENRPVYGLPSGIAYFDTALGKTIWWNGTYWIDAVGTRVTWPITYTLTNVSASNTAQPNAGVSYTTILSASTGYSLPTSVTVKMGSTTLSVGTDYTYDPSTGEIEILGLGGTGGTTAAIAITASGVANS